jgi:subtilisin family serine protease
MKLFKKGSIIVVLLVTAFLLTTVTPALAATQDKVRVWVSYQSDRKAEVFQALDKGKATFHYDFPELESYVVSLPESALNGILRNPFVTDVEGDPARYPIAAQQGSVEKALAASLRAEGQTVPWGIDAVQARDVWDVNRDSVVDAGAPTGSGITVCIIDTGYSAVHEDLLDEGPDVTGYSQVDEEWARDGYGHGSHVAGTISAINNAVGVVGVTPGTVNFHIVKIFDDTGAWVAASDLTAAIYNCRDNGAKIISMSLGGTSSNRKEQRAFDTLYSGGILHVAAAGNEQETTPGAFSYPASYSSVMSVAAVDENLGIASFSLQNSAVEIAAPGVGVLSTIPYIENNSFAVAGVNYAAYHIEFSAFGTASGELVDGGLCTSTDSWGGKVVLCERGINSFLEKVMNVQNSGGAAAVIYNNVPGPFLGTLGDATSNIIGLSLSQEDGQDIVKNKLGLDATIVSQHEWPANGYEAWDGTSMATPHVSGVAALVWSSNPNLTNVEIREALTATAQDLGATGRDVMYGYGLVQASDALQLLGGGTEDYPPSITITNPPSGATVSGVVTLTASAIDDFGVSQVEFFVNGASLSVDSNGADGWTANWDTALYLDGSYTVSATATDSAGQVASDSVIVNVDNEGGVTDPLSLSATGYKLKGKKYVDLNWTGATTTNIDVYRDGTLVVTTANDGFFTDGPLGVGGGSNLFMVCEAGSTTSCSNEVTVIW